MKSVTYQRGKWLSSATQAESKDEFSQEIVQKRLLEWSEGLRTHLKMRDKSTSFHLFSLREFRLKEDVITVYRKTNIKFKKKKQNQKTTTNLKKSMLVNEQINTIFLTIFNLEISKKNPPKDQSSKSMSQSSHWSKSKQVLLFRDCLSCL